MPGPGQSSAPKASRGAPKATAALRAADLAGSWRAPAVLDQAGDDGADLGGIADDGHQCSWSA